MKKVLIYGDSNTWGDNFITGKRIPNENQWPNILSKKLGSNYKVLQEGLPGRLAGDEEEKKYKNGRDTFIATFKINAPIDIVIIALGTNDLQIKYNKSAKKVIEDLLYYKAAINELYCDKDDRKKYFLNDIKPTIKYILPFNFDYKKNASIIFNENSEQKRLEIIKYFMDNNIDSVVLEEIDLFEDGIHLNYSGHEKMAKKMEEVITKK